MLAARSFYLSDILGSTRGLTNAAGAVTDADTYDAYGNLIASTGNTGNPYLFTGQWFDAAIAQYYMRARDYSPSTGDFTSRDTYDGQTANPITLNQYAYAGADPVGDVDLSGHDFSIAELSSVSGIENTINVGVGYINTLLRIQNTVNSLIDIYNFFEDGFQILERPARYDTCAGSCRRRAASRSLWRSTGQSDHQLAFATVAGLIGQHWNPISNRIRAWAGDIARDVAAAIAPRIPAYVRDG